MLNKEQAALLFLETSLRQQKKAHPDTEPDEKVLTDFRKRADYLAQRFLEAIDSKNIDAIRGFLWRENKAAIRIFRRHTGLKFGRTQKEIDGAIRAWVGAEHYDAHQTQRQKLSEERRRRREEDAHNRRLFAALSKEYKTPEGVKTIKTIIDETISKGFTKVLEKKRGFATVLYLHDGQRGIAIKKKYEQEYAWTCLEALRLNNRKENDSCDS